MQKINRMNALISKSVFGHRNGNHRFFGLSSNDNNQKNNQNLLDTIEERQIQMAERFCTIVKDLNYRNIHATRDTVRAYIGFLNMVEESAYYLIRYTNVVSNGRIFSIRLKCKELIKQMNDYVDLIDYHNLHESSKEYFTFDVKQKDGRISGIVINKQTMGIVKRYFALSNMEGNECN